MVKNAQIFDQQTTADRQPSAAVVSTKKRSTGSCDFPLTNVCFHFRSDHVVRFVIWSIHCAQSGMISRTNFVNSGNTYGKCFEKEKRYYSCFRDFQFFISIRASFCIASSSIARFLSRLLLSFLKYLLQFWRPLPLENTAVVDDIVFFSDYLATRSLIFKEELWNYNTKPLNCRIF